MEVPGFAWIEREEGTTIHSSQSPHECRSLAARVCLQSESSRSNGPGRFIKPYSLRSFFRWGQSAPQPVQFPLQFEQLPPQLQLPRERMTFRSARTRIRPIRARRRMSIQLMPLSSPESQGKPDQPHQQGRDPGNAALPQHHTNGPAPAKLPFDGGDGRHAWRVQ